ncbi:hypothetical protein GTO10_01015, partial [Candidatus Saccharibacteria bacterium]|nr:hypothetical protein [Candidatus Saccharibacteria bacterium]
NIDIHLKLAFLYLEQSQYELAVEEFRKVLVAKPNEIVPRYYMALALEELGK